MEYVPLLNEEVVRMSDKERWEREKEDLQFLLQFDLARETRDGAIRDDEVESIICDLLKDGEDNEYLVDGALLTCTSAKWGDFKLSDDEIIKMEKHSEKLMSGVPTEYLRVPENKISANGLRYATVADTKRNWNIMPFPCNCREPASPEQEARIKENKVDCQSHGVCKYLMDLEEEWENYDFKENLSFSVPVPYSDPVPIPISMPVQYEDHMDETAPDTLEDMQMSEIWNRDSAQRKKGITMTSVLFCKHGGFIYPCTSGQTVVQEDISEFLSKYQLTGKQYMALYEIKDYLARYPELRTGTAIFVFEGLATPFSEDEEKWNGINTYHPNGQFGAILITTEDGVPKYAVMKASTLSDDMETYATICEGVYDIKNQSHKGYAGLWLNNNDNIPAYNSRKRNDYAKAIHFHMAGRLRKDHPGEGSFSQGCITIPLKDYLEFGVKVGFINSEKAEDIRDVWEQYEAKDYSKAKVKLDYQTYTKEFNGYMVIDRQYYDDAGKHLKFNGPRGRE